MRDLGLRVLQVLRSTPKYKSYKHLCQKLDTSKQIPIFQQSQTIIQNQRKIRQRRMETPRFSVEKSTYAKFLRKLYPLEEYVVHEDLYNAYCSLPSPQPLHIEPQHFEQFLCHFTNSGGTKRGNNTKHLVNIISDMVQSEMKASLKEINNYLYLKNYNQFEELSQVETDYQNILDMGEFDISTFNIFIKYAIQSDNRNLLTRIFEDISEHKLEFDRTTYEMLIRYTGKLGDSEACLSLFDSCLKKRIVLDNAIINAVISVLVHNEDVELAAEIAEILFKNSVKNLSSRININSNHLRRQNLEELKYLDFLKIQKPKSLLFIPDPSFNTFSPLLTYYSSLEHFEPSKIFKYLEEQTDLGIEIPNSVFIHIFKAFQTHDVDNVDYLFFTLRFLMNEKNVKINTALFDSIIDSFLRHSNYKNNLVNGIERQWNSLKISLKDSSFKKQSAQIAEFSTDAIDKLLTLY